MQFRRPVRIQFLGTPSPHLQPAQNLAQTTCFTRCGKATKPEALQIACKPGPMKPHTTYLTRCSKATKARSIVNNVQVWPHEAPYCVFYTVR